MKHLSCYHSYQGLDEVIQCVLDACSEISQLLRVGNKLSTTQLSSETTTSYNHCGEEQKVLDVVANKILKQKLHDCSGVYAISSEEEEEAILLHQQGEYLVSFDPLDGSSNIDVNAVVGTIFSIHKKLPRVTENLNVQFHQCGRKQVAAGLVVYGVTTNAIIGFADKRTLADRGQSNVHEFQSHDQQWQLVHEHLTFPKTTNEYAINASNQLAWSEGIKKYVDACNQGEEGVLGKKYNMRWVGSMVADMYRIFCRGGVFLYPEDSRQKDHRGKLRLLYEANPTALLVELCSGLASDGEKCILDVPVEHIHQRVPVILGSKDEVGTILNYINEAKHP